MRGAAVLVGSAVAATLIAVGGGVLAVGGNSDPGRGPAPFTTTPLSDFDTTKAVVARGPFCDQLDPRQAEAALDAPVDDSHSWRSGDTVEVSTGVTDVVHEFGCEYAAADGTVAHAWVYAPPITREQAKRLVRSAGRGPGCQAGVGPAFGDPTLALSCTKDGVVWASYRGLFGDAWLVCEVVRPAGATWAVTDRAGRWCVGVLEAASGALA